MHVLMDSLRRHGVDEALIAEARAKTA